MIDDTSLKIMNELIHDGRYTNVELAHKLSVNVVTVGRKINAMIENDVIVIKAMPNPEQIGFLFNAFIGLKVNLKRIDQICAEIISTPEVNTLSTSFGRFNILLIVFFKEWWQLQKFIKERLARIDGVNHIETYLILSEELQASNGRDSPESNPVSLDKIDKDIIKELMLDGRPNYGHLAHKLGISKPTVSRRIAYLLKESIIRIVAIPNPAKLGYFANAFVLLQTEIIKVNEICHQLNSFPEVYLVMRLMNDFDILFGVYSAEPDILFDFMKNKIAQIDGILSTEIIIRGNYYYFNSNGVCPPT